MAGFVDFWHGNPWTAKSTDTPPGNLPDRAWVWVMDKGFFVIYDKEGDTFYDEEGNEFTFGGG